MIVDSSGCSDKGVKFIDSHFADLCSLHTLSPSLLCPHKRPYYQLNCWFPVHGAKGGVGSPGENVPLKCHGNLV